MSARGPHHQLRPDPLATAPDRFVPVPAEVIHPHVGAHALLSAGRSAWLVRFAGKKSTPSLWR